jgi:transposase
MFLPASSSNLNPIEHVWAIYKRRLTARLASYDYPRLSSLNTEREVRRLLEEFSADPKIDGSRIAESVRKEMLKVFKGLVV